jgi:hypothetical protein
VQRKTQGIEVKTWNTGRRFVPRRTLPFGGYEPSWTRGEMAFSGNTATYSLEAAALMGFTDIRLLGIDLRFDLPRSHFFGKNLYKGRPRKYPAKHIARVAQTLGAITVRLADMGIRVTNESPYDGPLDEFVPKETSPWLRK